MSEARNVLPATNEDTCGPYFPIAFREPAWEDLTQVSPGVLAGAAGQPILLTGRVLDRHGDLANGVLLEFWQANAKGVYRTPRTVGHPDLDPWFDGYGRLRADDGRYAFRTIRPGAAPGRAPCLTITLFSDGINRVVTQMFFPDAAEANAADPLLAALPEGERARLVAEADGRTRDGALAYRFDIVLAGAGETPFFDDLES